MKLNRGSVVRGLSTRLGFLAVLLLLADVASAQFTPAPGSPFNVGSGAGASAIGDFNGDGKQDIAVLVTGGVAVLLGNGSGGLTAAAGITFPVGSFGVSIAVADLNGDGKQDLVIVNGNSPNLTVLLGNGLGGFSPDSGSPLALPVPSPVGTGVGTKVVVADFNRDGKQDLAIATPTYGANRSVVVLLGDGAGGLTLAPGIYPVRDTDFVVVGDFNGDGIPDLALGTGTSGTGAPTVLLGSGTGGFTVAPAGTIVSDIVSAAVADFNLDGKLDLAVASVEGNNVSVLLGNGSGGFTAAPGGPFAGASSPVVADFNGDGFPDLAVVTSSGVELLLGNGLGGFVAAAGGAITAEKGFLFVADLNADGRPDLIISNADGLTVLLNSLPVLTANPAFLTFYAGTGQPGPAGIRVTVNSTSAGSTYTVASNEPWHSSDPTSNVTGRANVVQISVNPGSLSAGTYSGIIRYAAPNFFDASTIVTLNVANPSGTFVTAGGGPFAVGTNPANAVVADFNRDGKPDLAVVNQGSNNVTVLLGNGSGGFSAASGSPFAAGTSPNSIAAGDFNGDGKPDLAVLNQGSNDVTILLGNGSGGFRVGPSFGVVPLPSPSRSSIAVGDFNGDGIQDLVLTASLSGGTPGVLVMLGNGFGGFTPGTPFVAGAPTSLAVGDLNGDGKLDVVFTNIMTYITDPPVTMLLGDGLGGFTVAQTLKVTGSAGVQSVNVGSSIAVEDLNGDGTLDIAVGIADGGVALLYGNGTGGFTATVGGPSGTPSSLAAGDFNGDGVLDLAIATNSGLTALLGNFKTEAGAFIAAADFNGDGRPDLAVVNASGVTVLLGALASTQSTLTTTSPLSIPYGISVPLTLTVSGTTPLFNLINGVAAISDGATILWTSPGQSSPFQSTVSNLGIGSHLLSATFTSNETRSLGSSSNAITIQVVPASQIITFRPLSSGTLGIAPFTISATASSGLQVSLASSTPPVCTLAGNTVTIVAAGSCTITATQSGNSNYVAAPSVTQSFTVSLASAALQTITFPPLSNVTFGIAPFTINATASSGLPITLTSTTVAVCTIAGKTVTIVAAGTCSITASQAGNANYRPAPAVVKNFKVNQIPSGTLTIAPGNPFPLGTPAVAAAVGDFNGDGKQDLAVVSSGSDGVTILLGNGTGGFSAAPGSPFALGSSISSIAAADFNGDGNMDLAVAGIDGVALLLGDGLGGFSVTGPAGSPYQASIAAGDFNGDGIPDLVETVGLDVTRNFGVVTVLLGNGSGGFTPGPPFRAFTKYVGTVTAVGDFNRDGNLDVIVKGFMQGGALLLLGNGSGGFTVSSEIPFQAATGAIAVGDFNKDGIPDLASGTAAGVQVLLGDGSGGFNEAPGSPISFVEPGAFNIGARSVALGDFNGDGIQDLAVQYDLSDDLTVLVGNGSGGFTQAAGGPVATGVDDFFPVADFNKDGRPDLAIFISSNLAVLLGASATTSSTLTTTSPSTVSYGTNVPLSLAVSDSVPAFNAPTGAATFSDGATALGSASQAGSPYSFTVSGLSAGSHTLSASYGGDTRSLPSSSNSITIQVTTGSQTITFGPLNNVTLGVAPFTISATASSGLPITFASTTPAVCTVTGSAVTILATGTCSITASQAGNANYSAAPSVTQSLTVSSSAGPPVTDNFNASALNTSLWTFLNPVGNGSFSMTGTQLKLNVPAGSNHDPVVGGADNSVRVVQSIANTDFTVTVKFDSIPNQLYEFEGIVVNQDAANYLRFQFGSTASTLYATASVILSHNETSEFSNPITLPGGTVSLWLKVQKAGNTWTESWSPNGTTFNTAGTFTSALTAAGIGLFAANYNPTASSAPGFSALVDAFGGLTATAPDLTITKSHTGNFTQGQTGATYTITVTNSGGAQTNGLVTVSDTVPPGLTATAIAGAGWACTQPAGSCTRNDALAPAASYPALTLTVNVANNTPATVTNTATVSGGGETNTSNDTASDTTSIGSSTGPPVTDNFNASALNTSLWTFLNPVGNGSFSMTGAQLKLNVPAGSNHDPVFGGVDNSVRVVQSIANTDFTVTVKFDSIPNQLYEFEGVVVNQDAANYLRFQFGSTANALYATASVILAHDEASEFSVPITLPSGTSSLWLRVQKAGNTWTESWSPNGTTFNTAGTFTSALTAAGIGPFAANYNPTASSAPGFSAQVDSFVSLTTTTAPDLTIANTHTGNFTQGQAGATYAITVTNSGGAPTSGTVAVSDTVPIGLTATSIAGAGWTCTQPAGSCTRNDALAPAASYPALTLTVSVAGNAPARVTNTATVSGGGEPNTSNDTASDTTSIGSSADLPVTDNFNTPVLNTSLWTFLNPVGNGSFLMTGTQLKLNVPAGSNHDPVFGGADDSVRVVQSIANTDFTVTVKFDSIPNQLYEFEGIVVNQDAATYLRFQFGSTATTLYVTASVILAHNETSEFSNPIVLPGGTNSLWLRVQKAGNTWTESWSANGTAFNTAGTFTSALTAAGIGPFAANYNPTASSAPGFSAQVDSFVSGASGTN